MDLSSFMQDDRHKDKMQRIFSKGVRMIYQDALKNLMSDIELIDRLVGMERIPSEITSDFLRTLKVPEQVETVKKEEAGTQSAVTLIKTYDSWEPVTPTSFLNHFVSRYKALSQMLWRRPQLKNAVSIAHLARIRGREELSLIGMVQDIRESNDGRRFLTIEDTTGSIRVIIPSSITEKGEIVTDEVIGVKGQAGRGIFFANSVVFPDIPPAVWPEAERPKALFLSDLHVGSDKFVEEIWDNCVSWIKENKDVKYVFIAGDLVDGVGVYAKQNLNLEIDTAEGQMEALAKYLKQVRSGVRMFAISGNHDPNRDSEPQPVFSGEFRKPLDKVSGLELQSNPCWLNVEGVKILLYHGTSLDGLIDSVEPIRNTAYQKPYQAQKYLLKKRHLSPVFGRNKIFPDKEDFMVIKDVPNVFHTGHVHTVGLGAYRGVRLVSSGTFQNTTDFQEKIGHKPTPGKFVVMDLSNGASDIVDISNLQ